MLGRLGRRHGHDNPAPAQAAGQGPEAAAAPGPAAQATATGIEQKLPHSPIYATESTGGLVVNEVKTPEQRFWAKVNKQGPDGGGETMFGLEPLRLIVNGRQLHSVWQADRNNAATECLLRWRNLPNPKRLILRPYGVDIRRGDPRTHTATTYGYVSGWSLWE